MIRSIPLWVTVLTALITLSGLAFSVTLYFSPQTFFPATNFFEKEIHHLTDMWAMEQFSMSALLVYALILQKKEILLLGLRLMIFLNILMVVNNVVAEKKGLIGQNLVYAVVCIVMVIVIKNRKTKTL